MPASSTEPALNPLEHFLQDYLPSVGGDCDPVEPEVYDLLLPERLGGETDIVRVTFDPEALPEHVGSQFLTLGTPLLDRMLADAKDAGRYSRGWMTGLNTRPFNLPAQIRRVMKLPADAVIQVLDERVEAATTAVFWFAATYASERREQELFQVAIDLRTGREVRHIALLLDPERLTDQPIEEYPIADRFSSLRAYEIARSQVVRTVGATANQRRRELAESHERQRDRMTRYYRDLIDEIDAMVSRSADAEAGETRRRQRRQAAEQERALRFAELTRRYSLQVDLSLTNLLEVLVPKVLVRVRLSGPRFPEAEFTLAWDPCAELVEAPDCPACHRPSFELSPTRPPQSQWVCPACHSVKR